MTSSEAYIFGRYLLKTTPSTDIQALYEKAIANNVGDADAIDSALLHFLSKRPYMVAYIDAGLAFTKPNSEVRRRLYVMFSILEASPLYHDLFLPKRRSASYLFVVIGVAIRSIFRALVGIIIIKAIAR